MMRKSKTKFLTVRMEPSRYRQFLIASRPHGGPSEMTRKMVTAFLEKRLQIYPTIDKGLNHVPGSKD